MKTMLTLAAVSCVVLLLVPCAGMAETKDEAVTMLKRAQELEKQATSKEDLKKALELYENALRVFDRLGASREQALALNNIGMIYGSFGEYPKALEYYQRSLEIDRKLGDLKGEGVTLNNIGLVYNALGQYPRALEYYEKSLDIRRKANDAGGEGVTLNDIGLVYYSLSQYTKALEYYERSLQIYRRLGDVKNEGTALNNIGSIYEASGQYPKALEHYEKSLHIHRKLGDIKGEGVSLNNIGSIHMSVGQYVKALEYYEKSLQIDRKLGDVQGEGVSLNNVGFIYKVLGQYPKALEYYEKSLDIRRKVGDVKGEANSLNNIGLLHDSLAKYAKALEYYEKSLQLQRKLGDVQGEGVSLNNIGSVYEALGRYPKALEYYERSLDARRKVGDARGEGGSLNNIGLMYKSLGDCPRALEYYERSLDIRKKVGDVHGEATTLHNMAGLYESWGQYVKALERYEQSLELHKKIGVPHDTTEDSIGNLYLTMREIGRAEVLLRKANKMASLGRLSLVKSDFKGALELFQKQLKWAVGNRNVNGLFAAHTGLGLAYEGLHEYDKASEHFKSAIDFTEEIRDSLTEAQRIHFYDVEIWNIPRITPYEGLARVLLKSGKSERSLKQAESTKARVFAEALSKRGRRVSFDVPERVLQQDEDINNKVAALTKLMHKAYEKGSKEAIEAIEKQVTEARTERDRHVSMLRKDFPLFAATKYPQPMDLHESALKDNEWLLEYEVTDSGICIYLVHGKKIAKALFKSVSRKDLDSLVRKFREPLEIAPGDDPSRKLRSFDCASGTKLADLLLGEILPDLPKATPVIIVADEALGVVPFEMLVLKSGEVKLLEQVPQVTGAEFFGDRNPISYYQSVTALTLARILRKRDNPGERLLVMADPVFQLKDRRAQAAKATRTAATDARFFVELMASLENPRGAGLRFGRLPLTGELAENLQWMFKGRSDILTGLDASKEILFERLASQMTRYGTIVFATHGYFSVDNPGIMEPILVLTTVPPGTDGLLRMSEVMGLRLNADTVALTACQTGLGRTITGEGTMGMGRAFQYAGARSVLVSLWSVAEQSSVKLVQGFFRHRQDGKNKLDALNLARDHIRKEGFDHPFFWAPFILVGETD